MRRKPAITADIMAKTIRKLKLKLINIDLPVCRETSTVYL